MQRYLLSAPLLLSSVLTFAQQGTISGIVTTNEAGKVEPLPFVSVVIKGTTTGASTDLDGNYFFKAEPGDHLVAVSFVGFNTVERSVTLVPGGAVTVDIEMASDGVQMKEFEIVEERRTESETAVMMETRRSEQVVNGMGREQISKGQDRTAGDVVKRIPGVTIIGDRFIMIRGLADRYNTVMLNDVIAPSMESDRRAFSFDIMPSARWTGSDLKTAHLNLPENRLRMIKLYT